MALGLVHSAETDYPFELMYPTEPYDQPQIRSQDAVAESLRLGYASGRMPEEGGLLDVAAKRRPKKGFETSKGVSIRVCLNGEKFKLGHPPRLFLFLENKSGSSLTLFQKGTMIWAGVVVKLRGQNGELKTTTLYDYQQEMALRDRRFRMRAKRRDNNFELLYSGWIEDAFGKLPPGQYTLNVQVQPDNLYVVADPMTPPPQAFIFEVLSEHHRFYTNQLDNPSSAFKQNAEQWRKEKLEILPSESRRL